MQYNGSCPSRHQPLLRAVLRRRPSRTHPDFRLARQSGSLEITRILLVSVLPFRFTAQRTFTPRASKTSRDADLTVEGLQKVLWGPDRFRRLADRQTHSPPPTPS